MVLAPSMNPAGLQSVGQLAVSLQSEPDLALITPSGPVDGGDRVRRASCPNLTEEEAVCLLKEAQALVTAGDPEGRAVIDELAKNPFTPAGVLHDAVVFHDGTNEQERDWRHGEGSEATTRLVVKNPSTAVRTLEVIAGTEGGKVRYEAWKQLRVRR